MSKRPTPENGAQLTFHDVAAVSDKQEREALLQKLVSQMTLEEKVGQMSGGGIFDLAKPYGSTLFDSGENSRLGIPPLRFSDGPRGVMLGRSTCFPAPIGRGATWDPALEERVGEAMGVEARAQGANLSGAVCINALRHPCWGRAQETFGEDPFHLGEMGAAVARGLQKNVMACAKHFAANSIENARFFVNVKIGERALREIYLPHFKKCVDAGAASVMGAYNILNGKFCCHNRRLLTEILKEEWGFDGYVISDFLFGVRGGKAAEAGLDVEMPTRMHYGKKLKKLIERGDISEKAADEAALRVLRKKAEFLGPNRGAAPGMEKVACKEHAALAREVAQKSVVLLKNEGGALPLDRNAVRRIAVFGRLARATNTGDKGSSIVRPPYAVSPLEGLRNAAGPSIEIDYFPTANSSAAKEAARVADAAIVVAGLSHKDEGEYIPLINMVGDRTKLELSGSSVKLIQTVAAASKRCIVVLEGGSAIAMDDWLDDVEAVLMAWYPGMEGGNAIADILFGDVNPSGKLPIVFPKNMAQLPSFNRWAKRIEYDLFHGYRLFDKTGETPLFPFGFGLSFTQFECKNLKTTPEEIDANGQIKIECEVSNVGNRAGDEVVQLYIGCEGSAVERAKKELNGFQRISLQPGESKVVAFQISAADLAYYDEAARGWKTEPAQYKAYVGPSSALSDLAQQKTFRIVD